MAQVQAPKADDHQFRLIDDVIQSARRVLAADGPEERILTICELQRAMDDLDNLPPF